MIQINFFLFIGYFYLLNIFFNIKRKPGSREFSKFKKKTASVTAAVIPTESSAKGRTSVETKLIL